MKTSTLFSITGIVLLLVLGRFNTHVAKLVQHPKALVTEQKYLFNDPALGFHAIDNQLREVKTLKSTVKAERAEKIRLKSEVVVLKDMFTQAETARLILVKQIDSLKLHFDGRNASQREQIERLKANLIESDRKFQEAIAMEAKLREEIAELSLQVEELRKDLDSTVLNSFEQGTKITAKNKKGNSLEATNIWRSGELTGMTFTTEIYVPKGSTFTKGKATFRYTIDRGRSFNLSDDLTLKQVPSPRAGFILYSGAFKLSSTDFNLLRGKKEVKFEAFGGLIAVSKTFTLVE